MCNPKSSIKKPVLEEVFYYETKDIQYTTQSSAGGGYDPGIRCDGQCGHVNASKGQ